MTTRSIALTERFFAGYGLWQIVGVLGLVHPLAFVVYFLGTVVVFALVWLDRRSLLKAQQLSAGLGMPHPLVQSSAEPSSVFHAAESSTQQVPEATDRAAAGRSTWREQLRCAALELEQPVHLHATLTFLQSPPLLPARIEWEAPSLPVFHFAQRLVPFRSSGAADSCVAEHAATATGLGYVAWTSLNLVVHSRLQLWVQRLEVAVAPCGVRVHPSFRRIPEQAFVERLGHQSILLQGTRKMLRGHTADQLHSIRRYQYPDTLRHIDAKKSAKYARLMTRVYDEFRAHHLIMALDLGRAMCGTLKHSAKHDYYLSACLMLAQHAIAAGDYVSFLAFAHTLTFSIRHSRTLASFAPLFTGDPRLQARETDSRFDLLHPAIASLAGPRSIVLVLTDVANPSVQQALLEALPAVCQRHLTVAVGLQEHQFVLDELLWELDPDRLSDSDQARLLYAYWLNDRFQLFRVQMARVGGGVVQGSDDTWLSLITRVYARLRDSLRA